MKKIIIIVVMVLCSFNMYSIDHGLISGFELGYNSNKAVLILERFSSTYEDMSNSLYAEIKAGYRIENFRLVGTYTSTMLALGIDVLNPLKDTLRLDLSYVVSDFTIGAFALIDNPNRTASVNNSQCSLYVKYYREF